MFAENETGTPVSVSVARPRRAVVGRSMLYGGILTKVRVPKGAKSSTYRCPETEKEVSFLSAAHNVPGGLVNHFFHGAAEPGKLMLATASIWEKKLDDGAAFLYVDYHPAPAGVEAQSRIVVINRDLLPRNVEKGWGVFETPPPIRAAIVVMPRDATLSPVDRELEKLIDEGWTEARRNQTFVFLSMEVSGRRLTRAHRLKK